MSGLIEQSSRHASYLTQMGGEGMPWVGAAPFTETRHIFQNIGDGTYFHSGSQSLRACVAAGVNITFRLLYNGAVAMTGGQEAQGNMSIPTLTHSLAAEGVKKIIVVSEQPQRWRRARCSTITTLWPREKYFAALHALEATPGVTVLINDQQCAAEKRRERKRGIQAEPNVFAVINEEVCEGCGNCGEVSNCMSLHPVETEFGLKTRIHQSSCNKDYSCLEGDCPSFVTVAVAPGTGLVPQQPPVLDAAAIPEPAQKVLINHQYAIYIPGVGGTGVVTVNALLCYAARMEGKSLLNLDQTGLAQKGGAVLSNVILTEGEGPSGPAPTQSRQTVAANKVSMGTADLYLVLDALGGVTPINLDRADPTRTAAVVNTTPMPTGEMIRNNSLLFPTAASIRRSIDQYTHAAQNRYVDAGTIAEGLFGDHMTTNLFMLGVAYQAGLLPLAAASIERAIALNGVAVQQNQQAFRYGRRYVCEPQAVLDLAVPQPQGFNEERAAMLLYLEEGPDGPAPTQSRQGPDGPAPTQWRQQYSKAEREAYFYLLERCQHLDAESQRLLAIRIGELIDYQDVAYATAYVDFVLEVAAREAAVCPGHEECTQAVVRQLYKVMAYKDEYEVARLHLKQTWHTRLTGMFAQPQKVYYHFHPPLLRALGLQRKLRLGPWFTQPLRLLRRMKAVRGTRWDLFGYARVRRQERQLIAWYRHTIAQVLAHLNSSNHALAVVIANAPDAIRGYEDIKLRRLADTKALVSQHLARFTAATQGEIPVTPSVS